MALTDQQLHRFARHLALPEIGRAGQERLIGARVLVIGAGGLGSPLLLYLAAAGIGTIGLVDDDRVDLSNLQRQIVHRADQIGQPKVDSAAATLTALAPDVVIERHRVMLTAANAIDLVQRYDIVADGSDNFRTRYLVNDACHLAGRTLVSAAVAQFDGQLTTVKSHLPGQPCYRCLYPAEPLDLGGNCEGAGVLGAVAGVLGTLQATETVKEILGIGETMAGRLLLVDTLSTGFRTIRYKARPDCALCGEHPTIRSIRP